MNIYLVEQSKFSAMTNDYDYYDRFTCAADTIDQAIHMKPSNKSIKKMEWPGNIKYVTATLLGVADESIKYGVIDSYYVAG